MVNNIYKQDFLKIIQLTDTHLFSNDTLLFGVNCNRTFDTVTNNIFKIISKLLKYFVLMAMVYQFYDNIPTNPISTIRNISYYLDVKTPTKTS